VFDVVGWRRRQDCARRVRVGRGRKATSHFGCEPPLPSLAARGAPRGAVRRQATLLTALLR